MSEFIDRFGRIIFPIVVILLGCGIGFLFSGKDNTWLATLVKPALNPPSWIFGIVWPILYIMIGLAAYEIYLISNKSFELNREWSLFTAQMVLNYMYSPLMFGLHQLLLAAICCNVIAVTVAFLIYVLKEKTLLGALLLTPYLVWLCFATYLGWALVYYN